MSVPRTVASIEARMGSSRLPGKILMDVAGKPSLTRHVERLRLCRTVQDVVVATSVDPRDDAVETWGEAEGVKVFRGSEEDVLGRVVEAHRMMGSELVVEVTGDSPLLDPQVIDMGVETFLANDCSVVSNTYRQTYPTGVDVQVFPFALLEEVSRTVADPAVREHVSLYFYEHPEMYRVIHLQAPDRWRAPHYRFCLDYPEDLAFVNAVYERLLPAHGPGFGVEEVMALLKREPELLAINIDCRKKAVR